MKEKRLTIRIPKYLDDQIYGFAKKYFDGDYSKALRYLVQTGLILSRRLSDENIRETIFNNNNGDKNE